jgi:hypothetical protein
VRLTDSHNGRSLYQHTYWFPNGFEIPNRSTHFSSPHHGKSLSLPHVFLCLLSPVSFRSGKTYSQPHHQGSNDKPHPCSHDLTNGARVRAHVRRRAWRVQHQHVGV